MKEKLLTLNDVLKGFRTLLLFWLPYAGTYFAILSGNLTALTVADLKVAAALAILPTVKLIITDAGPKILNTIADKLAR